MSQIRTIATSGSIPSTNQLALGDIAINTYDGKAYIKKVVGTTQTILQIGTGITPASASYATSSSFAVSSSRAVSSSFASTASFVNTLNQNVIVSGSLTVTASINGVTLDNTGWIAYTPTWTAASVNPSIGNGTIEGYYKLIGKTCFVRGNIAMGSTTTFGSGEWYVAMPFTASHADAILMTANLLDNGTAWYNATVNGARAGFNYKSAIQYQNTGGTATDINATQPFTWTSSDRFLWNGCYQIA
jgi:hypothetical protein